MLRSSVVTLDFLKPMHATYCQKGCATCQSKKYGYYEYVCHCDSWYVGRTTQRLQKRIKQHVPKAIRQKTTLTQEQGTHRSQPTRTQSNRKCKAKKKTQFEPQSDSAIGQHLLESNQCARNYSDSQFKILTTARSQFHLSLFEAVYISRKKADLCRQKQFVFNLQLFR